MNLTLGNHDSNPRPRACARLLRQAARLECSDGVAADSRPASMTGHLEACGACREEVRRRQISLNSMRVAAAALSADAHETGADRLSAARRHVVLDRSVARPGFGWGLLPLLDWRPALGMAAAAAVTISIGLSAWSLGPVRVGGSQGGAVQVASVAFGADLQVVADGSAVRLTWSSDGRSEHRVIRATDPRDLSSGRVATVRGNQWVDPESNGARLVFYRVD